MMNIELVEKKLLAEFSQLQGPLEFKEIGDGNVNFVYRVTDKKGQSYIIKYASDHIRSNVNRKLSPVRNTIEYTILKKQNEIAPGLIPEVFFIDEELGIFVMEDLKSYKILWDECSNHVIYPFLAQQMSSFLYRSLFLTTDLVLDSKIKKEMVKSLVNLDMCEISERLVFREPYLNFQQLNAYHPDNEELVQKQVYQNEALCCEVAILKDRFKNYAQSMLHGDLHSGSIFINDKTIKVFDPEFSFYGPMGYDIGNILATLGMNYVITSKNYADEKEYLAWLEKTLMEIVSGFVKEYQEHYAQDITEPMAKNELFKQYYLQSILADTFGYMGTEMLRRTIGLAKVPELKAMKDTTEIADIEKALVNYSIYLIMHRHDELLGQQFVLKLQEILGESK